MAQASLADLAGGDRESNAEMARSVLDGQHGPRRDVVLVNASAALVAVGKAGDFAAGTMLAREPIDSGAARAKLAHLARLSL